jgi:mannitol-specific phosphotransferase system IIBC component
MFTSCRCLEQKAITLPLSKLEYKPKNGEMLRIHGLVNALETSLGISVVLLDSNKSNNNTDFVLEQLEQEEEYEEQKRNHIDNTIQEDDENYENDENQIRNMACASCGKSYEINKDNSLEELWTQCINISIKQLYLQIKQVWIQYSVIYKCKLYLKNISFDFKLEDNQMERFGIDFNFDFRVLCGVKKPSYS